MNPYYKPYWLNNDELEHYGVKGMRWGVRHEDGSKGHSVKSKSKTINKKNKAKTKEIVDYPYSNDTMKDAMDQWYTQAKGIFDNMQGWGESDNSKWGPAYMQAAEELGYTELELKMLLLYQALVENGLTDRFSVCVSGDTNAADASQVKVVFYDMKNGDACTTIDECKRRKRVDGMKGRKKNIDQNAKPSSVKVDKRVNADTAVKIKQLKKEAMSIGQNAVTSMFSSSKKKKK